MMAALCFLITTSKARPEVRRQKLEGRSEKAERKLEGRSEKAPVPYCVISLCQLTTGNWQLATRNSQLATRNSQPRNSQLATRNW